MATWKKVLVSGSALEGSSLVVNGPVTMSATFPASSDSSDLVLVQAANGHLETRQQSQIQGVTTAVFGITGSGAATSVNFDATSGSLTFAGDILATASNAAGLTTVTLNLNDEAISGSFTATSASIATDIADATSSIGALVTDMTQATASIGDLVTDMTQATASIGDLVTDMTQATASIGDLVTDMTQATASIGDLVTDMTQATASIGDLVTDMTQATASIGDLVTDMTQATASIGDIVTNQGTYAISASIVGTANEVTVTGAANQGLTLGLPDDVHIQGNAEITGSLIVSQSITADTITITGLSLVDNNAAVISGSNIFGDAVTDFHQFTGSVSILGDVTASVFGDASSIDPSDIVVQNSDGHLLKAGTALNNAISSSFNSVSASIATNIASNVTNISTNTSNITFATNSISDLVTDMTQATASIGDLVTDMAAATASIGALETTVNGLNVPNVTGLEASASEGINFAQSGVAGGTSIGLMGTASFASSGTGLAIGESGGTITYTITPTSVVGAAAAQISGSWQGQNFISGSQVTENLPAGVISGSAQLPAGIVSGAAQLPAGIISGAAQLPANTISGSVTSTSQGQITINGNNVNITDLTTSGNPTFNNLTAANLTVTGTTTTVNTTNLNVEDQFILLNSGALASDGGASNDREDKDGGIIIDFGGGSGSAFFYDAQRAAWGVRGTNVFGGNQTDYLGYNTTSDENTNIEPQHIVTVVSKSADSNSAPPSAPAYGTGSVNSDVGNMHVNTGDGTIWIYS